MSENLHYHNNKPFAHDSKPKMGMLVKYDSIDNNGCNINRQLNMTISDIRINDFVNS